MFFPTARMVASRYRLLLGFAIGKAQTRHTFPFVHEASGQRILVGLHLAPMGSHHLLRCDRGHLRPYSHIQLLAAGKVNKDLVSKDLRWPSEDYFKYYNVDTSQAPQVCFHDSLHFCTTSTAHVFLYGTWCRASVFALQYRMNMPLAAIMHALFTGGGGGQ